MKKLLKENKKNFVNTSEKISPKLKETINSFHTTREEKDINYLLENENLKLRKKSFVIYDIASFDVETSTRGNYFYLCGVIDISGKYKVFYNNLEVIEELRKIKHKHILVYATNLGFDFNALCEGNDFKLQTEPLIRGNQFIMIEFKTNNNEKLRLLDTVNYGGLSVEKMGVILGKKKLKKPACLGRVPKNKKEKQELVTYNIRDCEITREFMILFQKAVNMLGGELKPTISSCALDIFRRSFLKYDVVREELILKEDMKDKIFKAYYGGRTEVFERGKIKDYYYGDVNSLYPSMMLKDFPDPLSVHTCKEENRELLKFEGVSYFELLVPEVMYPLLPLRIEGKLLFPTGIIKGYYTHVEIRRALELYGEGCLLKMNGTVYYLSIKPYFKEYVETLYNLRKRYKEENNEMEHCIKLLLNGLYGRFAMRNTEKITFFDLENYAESTRIIKDAENRGLKIKSNSISEAYVVEHEEYDGVASLPIWSVYVTAYARIKLHELILEYKPCYVDTDSVITNIPVADSKLLGELKLEKKIKRGIIIKPKLYYLDGEIKSKGIPIPKTKSGKNNLIKKILKKETIVFDKFVKTKEGIGRNIKVNSILQVSKNVDLEDSKRVWRYEFNPNTLEVSKPLNMTEQYYE